MNKILSILLIFMVSLAINTNSFSQESDENFDDMDIDVGDVNDVGEGKIPDEILNQGNFKDDLKVDTSDLDAYLLDEYFKKELNGKKGIRYTVDSTIKYIVDNSPEIKEAEWGIKYYKGLYSQAQGSMGPKLQVTSFIAPTPEIKGNTEKSGMVDFWDFEKWGYYYRVDATLLQPLYTFNRISSAKDAASNGIKLAQAERDNVKWQVINRTKELYYGHVMILTLYKKTLTLAETVLDEALSFAKDAFVKGDSNIKAWNVNQLEVAKGEIERNKAQAMKFIVFTQNALQKFLKLKEGEIFIPADEEIKPTSITIHPYEYYEKLAFQKNPLWRMVNAGVDATSALVEFEFANYFPIVGLVGQFGFGYANQVDDIDSSFANDPYNELSGGAAIGILWYFDLFAQMGVVDQKEAEHKKIVEKREFARDGIKVLLKEAYLDVLMYKRNIKTDGDTVIAAQNWLKNAIVPWKTGLAEAKDALEGLAALAMAQKNYFMSIYQFNMAVAKLSYMCGTEFGKYNYDKKAVAKPVVQKGKTK